MPILTDQERKWVCQAACDFESGNHLLRPREKDYLKFLAEVDETLNTPMDRLTERQQEILDKYAECTCYPG